MEDRKFRSILKRLSLIPLLAMTFTVIICIAACVYSMLSSQKQLAERDRNTLRIVVSQMENVMERVEQPFVEYVSTSSDHQFLRKCTENTSHEAAMVYESNVRNWLNERMNMEPLMQTAFVYYPDMEWLQFRGKSVFAVQSYITDQLRNNGEDTDFSGWRLIKVEDSWYLLYILHIGNFYGGEWIPVPELQNSLAFSGEGYSEEIYIADSLGTVTCDNPEAAEEISKNILAESFRIGKKEYFNISVRGDSHGIYAGFYSLKLNVLMRMPAASIILFALAFLAILVVAVVIFWLQKRIIHPVREIDEAMKIIAEGNVDYRLPVTDTRTYNEFDRLSMHFNAMMDELDETQFKLYETSLREQKTKLNYVSQQIRPHFILNALNIIYTYDESEFPLVKKMVMYLTAYFRYIVNLNKDFVETEQELEHTRNYLRIQKERYPHRFDYMVECGIGAEKLLIPPLIIQTFLENSIKYGMREEGRSFFFVNVSIRDGKAEIFIADSGKGFDEETLRYIHEYQENREYTDRLGVGIQNTIERLDILYGGQAELQFANEETGGATVKIRVPVLYSDKNEQEEPYV